MDREDLISLEAFCRHTNAEITFIASLQEYDLIEIIQVNDVQYVPSHQLPEVEKMVRLRNELNINAEGIEAICGLLQKISDMQHEIDMLKRRLRLYEDL
jgi:chaperone modulatory protein CbpM